MLALRLGGSLADPRVSVDIIDEPAGEDARIVVDVAAAGITKTEPRWSTSWTADGLPRRQPVVLGLEFSGRVCSIGRNVRGFSVGQRVLGLAEPSRGGAIAEQVSASAARVLPVPDQISDEEASVLPLAGATAWQAIVRHGEVEPGQRVLIRGGAGGVGVIATQIARWVGAHVTVTAAAKDEALCRRLGADEVIDFEWERFEDRLGEYDLVLDQIGGDVQERSWGVLKRGGRLVAIAGEQEPDQARARALGVTARFFIVDSNLGDLRQLVDLVAAGSIRPIIGKRHDFSTLTEAFDARSGRFAGKAVFVRSEAARA